MISSAKACFIFTERRLVDEIWIGGRRIEAATLLGLGRNTLTRKIQELGLEEKAPVPG